MCESGAGQIPVQKSDKLLPSKCIDTIAKLQVLLFPCFLSWYSGALRHDLIQGVVDVPPSKWLQSFSVESVIDLMMFMYM